jgi:hypothetical protein
MGIGNRTPGPDVSPLRKAKPQLTIVPAHLRSSCSTVGRVRIRAPPEDAGNLPVSPAVPLGTTVKLVQRLVLSFLSLSGVAARLLGGLWPGVKRAPDVGTATVGVKIRYRTLIRNTDCSHGRSRMRPSGIDYAPTLLLPGAPAAALEFKATVRP